MVQAQLPPSRAAHELLWLFTGLFAGRVLGQALQARAPQSWLPPFAAFQGSGLPYPLLLSSQLAILAGMAAGAWRVHHGVLRERPELARWLRGFFVLYMTGSVARILVGLTVPDAPRWFSTWIPAIFHLVLAGYVGVLAECYAKGSSRTSRWWEYALYPWLALQAFGAFALLRAQGITLPLALYGTIVLHGITVLLLERWHPARLDWRPTWSHIGNDALYMTLVQIIWPRALTLAAVVWIIGSLDVVLLKSWWPHDWHWIAQTVLMILLVDLIRYWVHRACHQAPWLWRLHAVHHSPTLLYSLNTARFHPLEKLLHFSADTLPFLLLGVAPEVLAGYFLVYSVNGLVQHSNIQLRYGILNYVVGSAETHRWHHALDAKEAACNYSSTTLLWDHVFGTWSLPARPLARVGIPVPDYPTGFGEQLIRPFRT